MLSPQVLYALQNVALVEVADPNRYAVSLADGGYYRVQPSDENEYAQFLEIVSQTGLQLSDALTMSTPLNYKDKIISTQTNTNALAGLNILEIQGPSEGEAWIVESFAAANSNNLVTFLLVGVELGGDVAWIDLVANWPGGTQRILNGRWSLSDGATLQVWFYGCSAGDDLSVIISGYSMELLT